MFDFASRNGQPSTPHEPQASPSVNSAAAAEPSITPPPQPSARDGHGRFATGNPGGPGNPFARRTAAFRRAFAEAITPEEIRALARQLHAQAQAGDLAAAKLVFAYTIGKPAAAVEPDLLDVSELKLFQQSSVPGELLISVLNTLPPAMALPLLQIAWPIIARQAAEVLRAGLSDPRPEPASEESSTTANQGSARVSQNAEPTRPAERTTPREYSQASPLPAKAGSTTVGPSVKPKAHGQAASAANGRQPTVQTAAPVEEPQGSPLSRVIARLQTVKTAANLAKAELPPAPPLR